MFQSVSFHRSPTCLLKKVNNNRTPNSALMTLYRENHWWPLNYPHALPVMQKARACRDVEHDLLLISSCCRVMNCTAQPTLMAKDSWWCKIIQLNSQHNAAFNLFDLPSAPLLVEGPWTSIIFISRKCQGMTQGIYVIPVMRKYQMIRIIQLKI